jgi:tRNA(fMet)-specific endonuclease VapC
VTYLVDTNTVSYIANGKSPAARLKLAALDPGDRACISSITEAELLFGLERRPALHKLRTAIEALLFRFAVLSFGREEAAAYSVLRARLERAGKSLSAMDTLIAAQAIAAGATLVTSDAAFRFALDKRMLVSWATDLRRTI